MRTEKRLVLFFAAAVAVCCVLSVLYSFLSLNALRDNNNRAVVQLVSNIRAHEPEITDAEIMQILNDEASTIDTEKTLRAFGITGDDWTVKISQADSVKTAAVSCAVCLLCGTVCFAMFAHCLNRQKRRLDELTDYLARINSGDYNLALDSNSENEDSRLQNEIYKTTVTLRESAQRSAEGRENLKTALSDISHQLKTPLTSTIIMTENLLDNPEMPVELRQEFLRDINRSSKHISFLVQSLLTLSKLDADAIVLKKQNVPLGEVFSEACKSVDVLAELKGVSVLSSDNSVSLSCDKKWLCEAITNIVKNCVEHTPEGGEVRLCAEVNRLYTKITVSDNGQGIDKTDLPHIFERFYKGKNSSDESVGIGLALSKAIIEKAGGTVRADSETGNGSLFTIKFFLTDI